MPDQAAGRKPAVVTIIRQAAAVAVAPKREIGKPGAALEVSPRLMESTRIAFATPVGPRCGVRAPKPQAIDPSDTHREPAIQHDEIGATRLPSQRAAQRYGVQVDQIEQRSIVARTAKQQVAGMEIVVADAGVMHTGDEFTECLRQPNAHSRLSVRLPGRQRSLDEFAQWHGLVETLHDEKAV